MDDEKKTKKQLIDELVEMRRRIAGMENGERLQGLLDTMIEGVVVIDRDGQITRANSAAEHILGLKRTDIEGRNTIAPAWEILRHNGTPMPPDEMVFPRAMKEKRPVKNVEMGIRRPDGSASWIRVNAAPLIGKSGDLDGVVGTFIDITDRKKAEEQIQKSLKEKEILLKEIHYRVKDNLQIISSLTGLQARYIKDEQVLELFKESQNRIQAIALVHDMLYRSKGYANVDFIDYIKNLADKLVKTYSIDSSRTELKLAIGDISLGVDQAIPCGLIINELVSNAFKHAFPISFMGKAEVGIAFHQGEGNKIELIVKDNGVGIPKNMDIRKTESLGLRLVIILAEDQLGGEVELDRKVGTKVIVRFKKE